MKINKIFPFIAALLLLATVAGLLFFQNDNLQNFVAQHTSSVPELKKRVMTSMSNATTHPESSDKEYRNALKDLNVLVVLSPDDAFAFYLRGFVHGRLGHLDLDMQDIDSAIALDHYNALFYRERAFLWERSGQLQKALADCNFALQCNPRDLLTAVMRARIQQRLGQTEPTGQTVPTAAPNSASRQQ